MLYLRLPLLILSLVLSAYPFSLLAETTLYACTVHGHTTLESTPSANCDTLKEYTYLTYSDNKDSNSGLRPGEIKALDDYQKYAIESAQPNIYSDVQQDSCNYYQALFNNAAYYIDTKKEQDVLIGPYKSAELQNQLEYAQSQMNVYCGR